MLGGKARRVVLVGTLAVLAACGGDDGEGPSTTDAPTTAATTTTTTTVTATTTPPPATTPPPTTPPTTTTSTEDLKAQIEADLVAARQRLRELQFHPTLDGLEETMATIAVPGSEYYDEQLAYIQELVRLGDVVRLGDPPVDSIAVEAVRAEGGEPTLAASITVCEALNLAQVTPAENSPVGEEIVAVEPVLVALRYDTHVVLTEGGWLQDVRVPDHVTAGFPGQATCGQ